MKSLTLSVEKDPDAVKNWTFRATSWLDGDTISSATVTAESGLTVDSYSTDGDDVEAWLSGGTAGQQYIMTCRITTAAAVTDDISVTVLVSEQ